MSITYALTRKEVGRANRQHLRRHPKVYIFQFFFLFFVIVQPTFIHGSGKFIDWGVMLIWFALIIRSIPKTQKKTLKRTVTLLESGVQVETQYFNTIIYWDTMSEVTFTEEFISIYVDRKVEVVVPKRCFASREDAVQFSNTLRLHVFGGKTDQPE